VKNDRLRELFRAAHRLATSTEQDAKTWRAIEALQRKVVAAGGPAVTGLRGLEIEARRRGVTP
jgi:hypothetical protein